MLQRVGLYSDKAHAHSKKRKERKDSPNNKSVLTQRGEVALQQHCTKLRQQIIRQESEGGRGAVMA